MDTVYLVLLFLLIPLLTLVWWLISNAPVSHTQGPRVYRRNANQTYAPPMSEATAGRYTGIDYPGSRLSGAGMSVSEGQTDTDMLSDFHSIDAETRQHCLIAARTGDGKTQTIISAMVHDIARGCQVVWCSPQLTLYHPKDQRCDLRPLALHFEQVTSYPAILSVLDAAYAIGETRKPLYRAGEDVGHPIVLYFDEWPAIVATLGKEAVDRMARIVRECRKLNIWVVIATQDALVETIGFSSGVRSMFATRMAGNVDQTTWRVVMGDGVKKERVERGVWMTDLGTMPWRHADERFIRRLAHLQPHNYSPLATGQVLSIDEKTAQSALNTSIPDANTSPDTRDTQTAKERRQLIRAVLSGEEPIDKTTLARIMPINKNAALALINQALSEDD